MINVQDIDDNECFKWGLIKHINPAGHNSIRITKADKDFAKRLHFEDTKFPVEITDIHKIEKKNSITISIFSY